MQFSDTTNNAGIVEQVRALMRVDATQWPNWRIANSANNWLDFVTGYAIGADRRFQWDDTNHTKLPVGTTNLVANQSDYSFLRDEQGNSIITLTGLEILDANGNYRKLVPRDFSDSDAAEDELLRIAGPPTEYDKIADNIVRLTPKPVASVTAGLKFYFQRTASYFVPADTVKEPGISPLLHRGVVIAAAYDGALTLGLTNLQPLSVERQMETDKMKRYFASRNEDERKIITSPCVDAV